VLRPAIPPRKQPGVSACHEARSEPFEIEFQVPGDRRRQLVVQISGVLDHGRRHVDRPGALAALAPDQMHVEPQAGEVGDAQRHEQPQLRRHRCLDRQRLGNPAGVVAQDLANPERREGQQAVAHNGIVELTQARQVLLGHAVALLRHLLVEPLDLLAVGIREMDPVPGQRSQRVSDRADVGVRLAVVAVEEEGQHLTYSQSLTCH
jgi:hypothetical protein